MGEQTALVSGDLKGIDRKRLKRILLELTKRGAFLFAYKDMSSAAIFIRGSLAIVMTVQPAEMWALVTSGAVEYYRPGKQSLRYRLAPEGRAILARLHGASAPPSEASSFASAKALKGRRDFREKGGKVERKAVNLGESPLGWLSRRTGKDGVPFLAPYHVEAGEKLRADFERGQLGPKVTQNWSGFLASVDASPHAGTDDLSGTALKARQRVHDALKHLGPDLSDAAFRICCFQTGLETVERESGWPARSGKAILKIALERLAAFYGLLPRLHENVAKAKMAAPVPVGPPQACAAREPAARVPLRTEPRPVPPVRALVC